MSRWERMRVRMRRFTAMPDELAALRSEVADLYKQLDAAHQELPAAGPSAKHNGDELPVEGVVEHLAALDDTLDGVADRLEALGRDGVSSTTAQLEEVVRLLRELSGENVPANRLIEALDAALTGMREDFLAELTALRSDLADALEEVSRRVSGHETGQPG